MNDPGDLERIFVPSNDGLMVPISTFVTLTERAARRIGEILKARREQQLDCAQGAELVSRKLAEVERKLADLQQLRDFLRSEKLRLETSAAEQAARSG